MERFWRTVGRSNGPTSMSDIAAFRASLIAFLCRRQPSRTLAAALGTHLAQFELHATPDTTEINGHHPVIIFSSIIRRFSPNALHALIVVSCIQAAESGDSLLNHSFHPSVISYVAMDA